MLTAEEKKSLNEVLLTRAGLPLERRHEVVVPEIAKKRFDAGARWALKSLWQDKPGVILIFAVISIVQVARGVIYIVTSLF